MAENLGTRVRYIGQNARRAQEDVGFYCKAFINGDVILDLDVIANYHVGADVDVLAQDAFGAQFGAGLNMGKVPDFSPITNTDTVVDKGGGVDKIGFVRHKWTSIRLKFQIPSTKFQINSKFQIPMTQTKAIQRTSI